MDGEDDEDNVEDDDNEDDPRERFFPRPSPQSLLLSDSLIFSLMLNTTLLPCAF